VIASFVDGHVALTAPTALTFGDSSLAQFGSAPWSYLYGTGGASATAAALITANPSSALTALTACTATLNWNNGESTTSPYYMQTADGQNRCIISNNSDKTKLNFAPDGASKVPVLRYTFSGTNGTRLLMTMTYTVLGRPFDSCNLGIIKNWTAPAIDEINTTNYPQAQWTSLGTHTAQGTYGSNYSNTMYTITKTYTVTVNNGDFIDFADEYIWDAQWSYFNLQVTVGQYAAGM